MKSKNFIQNFGGKTSEKVPVLKLKVVYQRMILKLILRK